MGVCFFLKFPKDLDRLYEETKTNFSNVSPFFHLIRPNLHIVMVNEARNGKIFLNTATTTTTKQFFIRNKKLSH